MKDFQCHISLKSQHKRIFNFIAADFVRKQIEKFKGVILTQRTG
jgi:hypothetical protein